MSRILVVDGAPSVRESVRMILGGEHEVALAASPEDGAALAREAPPDIVLAGGPAGGRRRSPDHPSPWLVALRGVLPAAVALRLVTLPFPFGVADLRGLVRRALAGQPGARPSGRLALSASHPGQAGRPGRQPTVEPAGGGRTWREALVQRVLAAADPGGGLVRAAARAAGTTLPALLVGERGTGRETLARWIHAEGPLRSGPFVAVSCAGLAPAELAARLRRLTTSAIRPTLFLKGLDDASSALQHTLLELLESGTIGGASGEEPIVVEVRPIASASDGLWERAERGLVAEPLIAALAVLTLALPPLRERPVAIAAAAGPLLEWVARESGEPEPRRLSAAALERLALYVWPGNLRELASVLARSAALAEGPVLEPQDLDFGLAPLPVASGPAPERQSAVGDMTRAPAGEWDQQPPEAPRGDPAAAATPAPVPGAPSAATPGSPLLPADGDQAPGADIRFAALAGELAHEIKNPLAAIKAFTQLLGEKFDDPEFRREFYRAVRRDVERIDHLVEGLLHASDATPREVRPTDLNQLIEEVLTRSEQWMIDRRVVAFKELAEGLPPVLTDPTQTRAAVFNVLARALALLPVGEDLFITTRSGPKVQLTVTYRDPSPVGVGRPATEGVELELVLARVALERGGGRLAVEREPGRRTMVTLEFPAA